MFSVSNALKPLFSYGYLGVPVFFVISGFIICYSLPANYKLGQFKTFMLKRVIRIEPPYIISILLILALNYSAAYFTHIPLQFAWPDFLFHFIYLNNFGLGNYYNVVYWTLGIEFQFYVLIGLLFVLINKSPIALVTVMALFLACSFFNVSGMQLIFPHLSIFGIGIITYFYLYKKQLNKPIYLTLTAAFLLQIWFYVDTPNFLSTAFALAVLHFWKFRHPVLDFFSNISFSLYLTHTIIGGKVINLGLRIVDTDIQRYLLFLFALLASIAFAYLFYIIVEKRAITFGKRVSYKIQTTS